MAELSLEEEGEVLGAGCGDGVVCCVERLELTISLFLSLSLSLCLSLSVSLSVSLPPSLSRPPSLPLPLSGGGRLRLLCGGTHVRGRIVGWEGPVREGGERERES